MADLTGLEATYCKMLDIYFQTTVAAIEIVLALPSMMAKRIIVFIRRLETVILQAILDQLMVLVDLISSLKLLKKLNKNKKVKAFCNALFKCNALINLLVNFGIIGVNDKANYDKFELYVCRMGVADFVNKFLTDQVEKINLIVDEQLGILNKWITQLFNGLLIPYEQFLANNPTVSYNGNQVIGIVNVLNIMSDFSSCAFAVCDFATTAVNKQDDWKTKLKINSDGTFAQKWMQSMLDKADEISVMASKVKNAAAYLLTPASSSSTVKSDEVAKDF